MGLKKSEDHLVAYLTYIILQLYQEYGTIPFSNYLGPYNERGVLGDRQQATCLAN